MTTKIRLRKIEHYVKLAARGGQVVELPLPAAHSLIADAYALHELVGLLPKCDACEAIATHARSHDGGQGEPAYSCDTHAVKSGNPIYIDAELTYAAVLRKLLSP